MSSLKTTAQKAGLLYLLFSLVAICDEFFLSGGIVVSGDAAATARNIIASELTYRISILTGFVDLILFVLLVVSLYNLFKDVNRKHAMLMVLLVSMGIGISLVNVALKTAPLILLSGSDYLSVFTKPQLDALALGFLSLRGSGAMVATAFWGLWLFPFGMLVIRSGFIPKLFGILLFVAGFAYFTSSVTSIVLPDYRHTVNQIVMPLYFGEIPIIFWLLIKGAKERQPQMQASELS